MKPSYPDYAPSGMPDFDQRQGGSYQWKDPAGGRWSHCGPVAVANSLWWLDSEFESNTIPPPTVIDNYPLVQAYGGPPWDDHDPQNVAPLVEHLAYLMDTDGLRTGIAKLGTNVFDMQAGITHYLSWSGVNPLGDVDGDGNVTMNDAVIVNAAMGTSPGVLGWDLRADIYPETVTGPYTADNIINANDLNLVTTNIGLNGSFYEHTVMAPSWDTIVEEVEICQDVVLLIAPWYYDIGGGGWYRYEEDAHFVTVAGLNSTTWEIVFSDPILDNAEAGGYGDVPVPHVHLPPEPPYVTHNNASLVSHDAYHVIEDPCPGGPLTITDYPRGPGSYPTWRWQIEAAVITSPYAVHDVAVTDVNVCYGATVVHRNYTCCINVTVENLGSVAETFDVTAYWNSTAVGTVNVALASGASTTIKFNWSTIGLTEYNAYNISAYAWPVPGEINLLNNRLAYGIVLMVHIGDVNADGKVRVDDVLDVALDFGTDYGGPANSNGHFYNPNTDITCDGKIRVDDVLAAALQFGWGPIP